MSEEQWRAKLTPQRFAVLRQSATEPAFSGELLHMEDDGSYTCAGCDTVLFTSDQKFDSHCGWPSFDAAAGPVVEVSDRSHGMVRTEILCGECGGHLGHVFPDGPTQTGLRYCVNSLSIDFDAESPAS
ncbi:MAG: peptide-methionine (R)-S-oxide reductase MsrB [Actinomycetes bacterium]